MIDPNDPGTLDLVAACEEPLNGAERARRHRLKKKREKEAGQRAALDLKAPELALLGVALSEFRERWQRVPSKLAAVDALLPRVPMPCVADAFPGDSAWLPDALQREQGMADWPASSGYQADMGLKDLMRYRQTPMGQPEVDGLVFPGDTVWTSYGSGPYIVKEVAAQECRGMRCFTLVLLDLGEDGQRKRKREADGWINEVVAVDGRLLKLFAVNEDEIFVAKREMARGYVEADEASAVRAECRRIVAEGHAAYERANAGQQLALPTFDELAIKLLPFKDRTLLEWARRNEQLVRDTPPEQVYPSDPEKRNVLGQVLCDKHELNGRYQVLLEQAIELYELVDLEQHTPRMSRPAEFLREYKRHSESYAGHVSAGSKKWTIERFKTFGKRPDKPGAWQVRAEKAEAELAYLHVELQQIGGVVPAATAEVERFKAQAPSDIEARGEADALRLRVAALERENQLLESERNKAHSAISTWEQRLRAAGVSTDYRKLPGEE
ncbi:hypothetical protein QFZ45_005945 [Pseudomonas synxantha]|nr:hypothetical protein [Pseudomonas synxantha]